ncbi:DUF421 domain-containing protein [Mobilicoccus caccae]|uniref:DUF421 domain-containing protein n=1 Tax=Mobilicoccus caccae TaxID=1859295 RepID=A0ABQ6IZ29_9MICO|nr:YetF domain-containing protein [Mobilicoccus caccae]GMA41969.1 DUF421 domain-containing protein [Mobilicoccus caccae]
MFFDDWAGLLRVLVVGTCAYVALIALLRVSGKRTLAKLNAFDFVVTVALGSTLATVLLSADVALAEGVLAMLLLVALQYVVAWLSTRSRAVERLVKSEPTLLYRNGFLAGPMRRARVTEDEIRQAARSSGKTDLDEVSAVVLETDGTLSVLPGVPHVSEQRHRGPGRVGDEPGA